MKNERSRSFQYNICLPFCLSAEGSTYQPGDGGTIDTTNGNNAGSGSENGDGG